MRKIWTRSDIAYLKLNYNSVSYTEIGNKLGRKATHISDKVSRMGWIRTCKRANLYSAGEDEYIKRNYETMSAEEIGKVLNRTAGSIDARRWVLNLKKDLTKVKNKGHFKKGHQPSNKGKKALQPAPVTAFKKGHKPKNTLALGSLSVRTNHDVKNYFIKTEKGMVLLHHHNYIKKHGVIPCGHIVSFLDGDTLNCDISNLIAMTRAENIARNRKPKQAIKSRKRRGDFIKSVLMGIV